MLNYDLAIRTFNQTASKLLRSFDQTASKFVRNFFEVSTKLRPTGFETSSNFRPNCDRPDSKLLRTFDQSATLGIFECRTFFETSLTLLRVRFWCYSKFPPPPSPFPPPNKTRAALFKYTDLQSSAWRRRWKQGASHAGQTTTNLKAFWHVEILINL